MQTSLLRPAQNALQQVTIGTADIQKKKLTTNIFTLQCKPNNHNQYDDNSG
jgi:hypothetical protein